ncbi:MAG: amino acid permease [Phycisphaeraceae bacterium]|nr:amino acid permease [Phycisphaeraceae bacterium]
MSGNPTPTLRREVGLGGAVLLGLGSILGTGVFVGIGIAGGIAGSMVVVAIVLAGGLAFCNAASSAQLAAKHPVSGGTYEYGILLLGPRVGFVAGWMFLCAKSASAATAALGFASHLFHASVIRNEQWVMPVAIAAVGSIVIVVAMGIRRANLVNAIIVSLTIGGLLAFIVAGFSWMSGPNGESIGPVVDGVKSFSVARDGVGLLEATALMFVAYTGYGRIATLGEEVRTPRTTIPRAIGITLVVSATLYLLVAVVAIGLRGTDGLAAVTAATAAPLEVAATMLETPWVRWVVAIAAVTAMLGVLLNLVLGLSRVAFAMGRRGDLPSGVARVRESTGTPIVAVILVGVIITGLVTLGSVRTTWAFSAFTVLVYYGITNLAALRLAPEDRFLPRAFAWFGLAGCGFLAFWVDWRIWTIGLGVILVGLVWRSVFRRFKG